VNPPPRRLHRDHPLAALLLTAGAGAAWFLLGHWEMGGGPLLLAAAAAALMPGALLWWLSPDSRQAIAKPARGPSVAERVAGVLGAAAASCGIAVFFAWFCTGPAGDGVRDVADYLGFQKRHADMMEDEKPGEEDAVADWDVRGIPRSRDGVVEEGPRFWVGSSDGRVMSDAMNGGLYLALSAYDTFDAASEEWSSFPVEPARLTDDDSGWIWFGGKPDPDTPEPYFVRCSPNSLPVPWLPGTLGVRVPGVNRKGEGRISLDLPGADTFHLVRTRAVQAETLGNIDRSRWLALPAGREALWSALASEAGDAPDLDGQAAAIVNLLAARAAYAEEFEWQGDGPVLDAFLNRQTPGTCEHFAACAALLLRASGIPSRLVYGYAGGAIFDPPGVVAFGPRDFHAWAEFWDPTRGWVTLEATPPGLGAAGPARSQDGEMEMPVESEEAFPSAEGLPEVNIGPRGLGLVSVLAALLAIGSLLARAFRPGGRFDRASAAASEGGAGCAQPSYYRAFLTRCRRHGMPRPRGATAAEHIDSLPDAWKSHPVLREMREYYYATRYAGQTTDPNAEQNLRRAISTLPDPDAEGKPV